MADLTKGADHTAQLLRLQLVLDASQDCIKILDLDAHLLSMNAGGMRVMEVDDFQQCQYALWPEFWEGDGRLQVEQGLEAARAGQTFTFEGPARTFAGTPRWWEVQISPLRDLEGTVTQLLAISRDITGRKTIERQLQDSEQRHRERAETLEVQVTQNEQALEAFVRFTTAVSTSTDLKVLATAAADIVRDVVGNATSGFYLFSGDTASPLIFSSNTPPKLMEARRSVGVSLRTPLVAEALKRRGVAFAEEDQGRQQSVGYATALSITPYWLHDRPYALFATGTERTSWTEQEKAIIESVGQGLGLALERVHQARQLQEERAGLDAFVAFTEAAGTRMDRLDLVRQAGDVLRATLMRASVAYYELEDGRWKAQVWSEDIAPEIVAVIQAGVPQETPNFLEAARSAAPVFVNGWDTGEDQVTGATPYGAMALIPLRSGETLQLFTIGTLNARAWTERERASVRAVGRSLTLALERTEFARQLMRQRDDLDLQTQELQTANEELEAFTYSASHDLRTPVRHVMGFAELAQASLKKEQYDKVDQYLKVVKQGAARMTSLIDGMLVLSRSGRQELKAQPVDLNEVVTQARLDVGEEFAGHPVHWQIGRLPLVQGDREMLQQVMTNLVSNAVKYSVKRDLSVVQIWGEDRSSEWCIHVQDNGVGFDPQYAGKLFGIFQRLHAEREFQGIGVGLATVKRIVLKHGGRVFAESPGESGATFSFTLPKRGL